MQNYVRVKIDSDPVEFYCPHCETVILTHKEGDEPKPLPSECPVCKKEIDPQGAQLYLGEIKDE